MESVSLTNTGDAMVGSQPLQPLGSICSVQTIPAGNLPTNSKLILNMFSIQTGNTDSPHLAINNRQLSASSQTVSHHLNNPLHLNLNQGCRFRVRLYFLNFCPGDVINYRILTILPHLQYNRSHSTIEVFVQYYFQR